MVPLHFITLQPLVSYSAAGIGLQEDTNEGRLVITIII